MTELINYFGIVKAYSLNENKEQFPSAFECVIK
jgi:hypothetical protein